VHLIGRAAEQVGLPLSSATAIVQGFGNVGSVTAMELAARGVRIIGVSDHTACLYDPRGLPLEALVRHMRTHHVLAGFSAEAAADPATFLSQPCDILVPAALERVIDGPLAHKLRCRILAEGANGPTTPEADLVLEGRRDEIFLIPDILCNAGGVVVSYFEWVQDLQQLFWEETEVNTRLTQILDRAFDQVNARVRRDNVSNRTAAMATGVEKVRAAKQLRGLFP
jgi:glutamate dehydrogenase (NAD(P)+)